MRRDEIERVGSVVGAEGGSFEMDEVVEGAGEGDRRGRFEGRGSMMDGVAEEKS